MRYPYAPTVLLPRSAARFALNHGVVLPDGTEDVVAELERALLTPTYAHVRGRWLELAWKNTRRRGIEKPALSRGRSNSAVRLLAARRLTPGGVVAPEEASRIAAEWNRTLRRVLGLPTDPAWRARWWVDQHQRYQVSLAFADDGSATIGYSAPCDRKCVNAGQSRPPQTLYAQESTTTDAALSGHTTAGMASHSATRPAGAGGVARIC